MRLAEAAGPAAGVKPAHGLHGVTGQRRREATPPKTTSSTFALNTRQHGDALDLLRSLPDGCATLVFFDPQHHWVLDKLQYGNEGEKQKGRAGLPVMSNAYIEECIHESARVLHPSAYMLLWLDTFYMGEAINGRPPLSLGDILECVDIIVWDYRQRSSCA